jgi:hypothetical protein
VTPSTVATASQVAHLGFRVFLRQMLGTDAVLPQTVVSERALARWRFRPTGPKTASEHATQWYGEGSISAA